MSVPTARPRSGPRRQGHVSPRDIARIKAMAESVTATYRPPILDDLDAPLRVGACRPGEEHHLGGHYAGRWAGCILLAWPLTRKAKDRRRKLNPA